MPDWTCTTCNRTMILGTKLSHLAGRAHAKKAGTTANPSISANPRGIAYLRANANPSPSANPRGIAHQRANANLSASANPRDIAHQRANANSSISANPVRSNAKPRRRCALCDPVASTGSNPSCLTAWPHASPKALAKTNVNTTASAKPRANPRANLRATHRKPQAAQWVCTLCDKKMPPKSKRAHLAGPLHALFKEIQGALDAEVDAENRGALDGESADDEWTVRRRARPVRWTCTPCGETLPASAKRAHLAHRLHAIAEREHLASRLHAPCLVGESVHNEWHPRAHARTARPAR
ncbi:hypothetical protein HWV62_12240 [Athelia sp. TMB]|nr:hypothetical protein HWV62_12240 [Athelia sp. TMB]